MPLSVPLPTVGPCYVHEHWSDARLATHEAVHHIRPRCMPMYVVADNNLQFILLLHMRHARPRRQQCKATHGRLQMLQCTLLLVGKLPTTLHNQGTTQATHQKSLQHATHRHKSCAMPTTTSYLPPFTSKARPVHTHHPTPGHSTSTHAKLVCVA
jgi:hypothetical protein